MSKSHPKQGRLSSTFPLATALRQKLKQGYTIADLKADLLAGVIVGMVAIPLGMALAIATGVLPQYGLYTVIFAGIVALLGGSRFNVTGPTAAFVVILAPIVTHHGLAGLLVAGSIAGVLLLALGVSRLGQVISFIPYPVTTGFTSGIAVVIAVIQVKDFFGLKLEHVPEQFFERVWALVKSGSTWSTGELGVACLTLVLLIVWPKINKRIPSPFVVLGSMTVLVAALNKFYPSLAVATIRDRFSYTLDGVLKQGIPSALPKFDWPWNFGGSAGTAFSLDFASIQPLMMAGIAIAMLGAIESLLCAVVADGITQTDHDPNTELVALGIGNIIGPFFGAIPATGAIVRTATSIRFGARSPLAAIFHSLFVLSIVVFCAEYVSYMPMASLAALLMYVAYGMFDAKHFFHCLRVSPQSDKAVLLTCFFLTVTFDMVIGVTVGVVLASLLFIQRMSKITSGSQWTGTHHKLLEPLPDGIMVYEIAGPLFFGAAERAIEGSTVNKDIKAVVFNLENVPTIDFSGLVAFESAILELLSRAVTIQIAGVSSQPLQLLKKSKVLKNNPQIRIEQTVHDALAFAKKDMLGTLI